MSAAANPTSGHTQSDTYLRLCRVSRLLSDASHGFHTAAWAADTSVFSMQGQWANEAMANAATLLGYRLVRIEPEGKA